jgi:hypothetical protein
VTRLRKMMLEELQRRNYAQTTVEAYIHALQDFASTSIDYRTSSGQNTSGSTRSTCCATGSWPLTPSSSAWRPYVSFLSVR